MERTQSPSNHIIIENQWNHPRAVSEFFRKLSNATKKSIPTYCLICPMWIKYTLLCAFLLLGQLTTIKIKE